MRGFASVVCFVAFAMSASLADAQPAVDEGRALWADTDYEQAAAVFDGVLADPTAPRDAILQAHRHLFAIRSVLGDTAAANRHGRAALALDAHVTPPEGAEALADRLVVLRSTTRRLRLELSFDGATRHSRLRLTDDVGLVESLTLRCVSGAWSDVHDGVPPTLVLPIAADAPGPELGCNATARTASRALLLEAHDSFDLPAIDPGETGDDPLLIGLGIGGAFLAVVALVALVVGLTAATQVRVGACVDGWSCE